jgi:hypothetical protein
MAAADHYRYLQSRIARCERAEVLYVVWAYSQFLQVRNFAFPNNIEKHSQFVAGSRLSYLIHEWELEIIATEALLHAGRGTRSISEWRTSGVLLLRL